MRWALPWGLVCLLLVASLPVSADEGRAAPNCETATLQSLGSTTDVNADSCVVVSLGALQPGEVYDLSIIIVDDAIDVLVFDENSLQPYNLGQSYRSSMAQPASTESALGALEFHWKVPPSISAKQWYIVLDNSAHDGDAGQGDQGGSKSTVSLTVAALSQTYWTPYHDLLSVEPGAYEVLLANDDLRLDAGTTVALTVWDLTFVGDVYLQTRTMHDRYVSGGVGVKFIEGGALQSVVSPQALTWQVPSALEGEELLLVVDNTDDPLGGGNGTEQLRLTVRLELAPPLTPLITDDGGDVISLGDTVLLNASSTPNRLGQQGTFTWDFDSGVDADGDGDLTNDADATGIEVAASWAIPGTKTVSVTMTAPSGEVATTTHTVLVQDTVSPTARIQADGVPVADGWRVGIGETILLNCASSTDDHAVESCSWTVDGETTANQSVFALQPPGIGNTVVELSVMDMSGNVGNASTTIRSVDPSRPTFDPSLFAAYPSSADEGETLEFRVEVADDFDDASSLRVHWDLDPYKDSDSNGIFKDDPNREGLTLTYTFDEPGLKEIVVTVFDASNNSNDYAFSVSVKAAPDAPFAYQTTVLLPLAVVALVAMALVANRINQRRLAFNLLIDRGLDADEARAHMAMTAQKKRLNLLSKAEAYAGLDAGDVVSEEDRIAAEKQAEMEALYGSSAPSDPNAGFAPPAYAQPSLSQASSQAAAEAAAIFAGGDAQASTPPEPETTSAVALPSSVEMPSPVALPEQVNRAPLEPTDESTGQEVPSAPSPPVPPVSVPAPPPPTSTAIRHACTLCEAVFEIDMPAGVSQAVVACPSCTRDQTITTGA